MKVILLWKETEIISGLLIFPDILSEQYGYSVRRYIKHAYRVGIYSRNAHWAKVV